MSFDNTFDMTDLGASDPTLPGNLWSPSEFNAYQMRDYLDLRSIDRASQVATVVMRLMSNRDVHLYGEFIMHDGGMRSLNTVGLTCVDSVQDIVSFRSGPSEGTERMRITKSGGLSSTPTTPTAGFVIENTLGGDGVILSLKKGGAQGVYLSYTATGTTLQVPSAGHHLHIKDSSGKIRFDFLHFAPGTIWQVSDGNGDIGVQASVGIYCHVSVGGVRAGGLASREGRLLLFNDGTDQAEQPGYLIMYNVNGAPYYLWVDANGKLRINNGAPASDASGVVVGTQT